MKSVAIDESRRERGLLAQHIKAYTDLCIGRSGSVLERDYLAIIYGAPTSYRVIYGESPSDALCLAIASFCEFSVPALDKVVNHLADILAFHREFFAGYIDPC